MAQTEAPTPGAASERASDRSELWPALRLEDWEQTYATLHRWAQIVGKTRLALTPLVNHWWNVTLYVNERGLTTSLMHSPHASLEVEFDFVNHLLRARSADDEVRLPLVPKSVAEFYEDYRSLLRQVGVEIEIYESPVEIEDATPFPRDTVHASYDADAANRLWRILLQSDRVFKKFRSRFVGKSSPVHFFWGSFDLAVSRFSGRPAPTHPGGAVNCPDWVMTEAYSHEVISAGFWPGGGALTEPAYYAYAYPEPQGLAQESIAPPSAFYHPEMREFILPYEAVRTAADPDAALTSFLQSTYEAAARLASWDRTALERATPADATA
jgi:hypothetical protein